MKKLSIVLLVLSVIYITMTFFVASMAEKEVKTILSKNEHPDFSVNLISYQRHFFSATAISRVQIPLDQETMLTLNIASAISHYPHQAVIKNSIKIADEMLAERAMRYFGTPNWLTSEEKINIFSQLTGQLVVAAGKYDSELESLFSSPLLVNYQLNLKDNSGDVQLHWAGLSGKSYDTAFALNSLQLGARIAELSKQSDYDYKLTVEKIEIQQENNHSLLEGWILKGSSQQGKVGQTIDTSNELLLRSYQLNNDIQQTFTDNRIKLALTGLYQPAFESLTSGGDDSQQLEDALVELINNGAQLTLSQLISQTPWGEVDGKFDLTLDKGTPLMDILVNPYILFDYMSGGASLVLPVSLLNEPALMEPLQMGVMTGFLLQNEQTLNLETTFQQGELTVNGQVIPL